MMFCTINLLAQPLVVPRSHIKMEQSFSLIGILTNSWQCRLQTNNLKRLIFVNKNWPDDPKFGCCALENMGRWLRLKLIWQKTWKKNSKVISDMENFSICGIDKRYVNRLVFYFWWNNHLKALVTRLFITWKYNLKFNCEICLNVGQWLRLLKFFFGLKQLLVVLGCWESLLSGWCFSWQFVCASDLQWLVQAYVWCCIYD